MNVSASKGRLLGQMNAFSILKALGYFQPKGTCNRKQNKAKTI